MKSRTRAPGLSSAHSTIWGAQGSRVRLTDGLARTKETPTSGPTAQHIIPDSPPFHPRRVGEAGGGLTGRARQAPRAREAVAGGSASQGGGLSPSGLSSPDFVHSLSL